jgi:hypothetical protein
MMNLQKLEGILNDANKKYINIYKIALEQGKTVHEFENSYFHALDAKYSGHGASLDQVIHPMFKIIYETDCQAKEFSISEMKSAYPELNEADFDKYFISFAKNPVQLLAQYFVSMEPKIKEEQVKDFAEKGRKIIYAVIRNYVGLEEMAD